MQCSQLEFANFTNFTDLICAKRCYLRSFSSYTDDVSILFYCTKQEIF